MFMVLIDSVTSLTTNLPHKRRALSGTKCHPKEGKTFCTCLEFVFTNISCSMFWRQISRNWRNSVASFRAQWQESYHHVWRPGMCHFSKVLVFKVEIQRCGREVTSCLSPRWGSWREPTTQRSKPTFAGGLHFNFLIVLNSRHKLWLITCTLAKALLCDQFHS